VVPRLPRFRRSGVPEPEASTRYLEGYLNLSRPAHLAVTNGSNILCVTSSVMPTPLSFTRTPRIHVASAASSQRMVVICILPPGMHRVRCSSLQAFGSMRDCELTSNAPNCSSLSSKA
jgi:hypothetical protein